MQGGRNDRPEEMAEGYLEGDRAGCPAPMGDRSKPRKPPHPKYSRFHFIPYHQPITLAMELDIIAAASPKKSPIHQPMAPAKEDTSKTKKNPMG